MKKVPAVFKILTISLAIFLFIKGTGYIREGSIFKGMVFPPNARKSKNIEDRRIPMPSPEITVPPSPDPFPSPDPGDVAIAPKKPEPPIPSPNDSPDRFPSPSPLPLPTDRTNPIPVGLPVGVIKPEGKNYEGWNLRKCPSVDDSCLESDLKVLHGGDRVNVYLGERAYNNGIVWNRVYSPRLNYSGWIAANGYTLN